MSDLKFKITEILDDNDVDVEKRLKISEELYNLFLEENVINEPKVIKEKVTKEKGTKEKGVNRKSAWTFFVSNSKEIRAEYKLNHKDENLPPNSMKLCKLIWDSEGFDKSPFEEMEANQ